MNALDAPLDAHFARLPAGWQAIAQRAGGVQGTLPGLCAFVDARRAAGATVFPAEPFAALHGLDPASVRVVILGQDPYHGPGQAHGFAFSVPPGVRPPPSLRNIFAELQRDLGAAPPASGDLRGWAAQGVLLLNSALTVEQDQPASHAGKGWEALTGAWIEALAAQPQAKVFLLWGAAAQRHEPRIAQAAGNNLVLLANHPSPLSARRPPLPFIGCGHFSRANAWLVAQGERAIRWG